MPPRQPAGKRLGVSHRNHHALKCDNESVPRLHRPSAERRRARALSSKLCSSSLECPGVYVKYDCGLLEYKALMLEPRDEIPEVTRCCLRLLGLGSRNVQGSCCRGRDYVWRPSPSPTRGSLSREVRWQKEEDDEEPIVMMEAEVIDVEPTVTVEAGKGKASSSGSGLPTVVMPGDYRIGATLLTVSVFLGPVCHLWCAPREVAYDGPRQTWTLYT